MKYHKDSYELDSPIGKVIVIIALYIPINII